MSEFDFDSDMFMPVNDALIERRDGSIMPTTFPPEVPEDGEHFEKRAQFIRSADGELIAGFDRDYYVDRMRMWKRNGEKVETFISGCPSAWHEDLHKIADEEGLL